MDHPNTGNIGHKTQRFQTKHRKQIILVMQTPAKYQSEPMCLQRVIHSFFLQDSCHDTQGLLQDSFFSFFHCRIRSSGGSPSELLSVSYQGIETHEVTIINPRLLARIEEGITRSKLVVFIDTCIYIQYPCSIESVSNFIILYDILRQM